MQVARRTRAAFKIDFVVDSELWREQGAQENKHEDVRPMLRRALAQAAAALSTGAAELAIVLTDDSAIRQLNHAWRGKDAATNVLSFPTAPSGGEPRLLGDIVLAHETITREARAERKPFADHVAHLAIHGFLHLLGYDHERGADAETMEAVERDILHRLGIPDPYRADVASGRRP
jgi:probable rRNA maturation factor